MYVYVYVLMQIITSSVKYLLIIDKFMGWNLKILWVGYLIKSKLDRGLGNLWTSRSIL